MIAKYPPCGDYLLRDHCNTVTPQARRARSVQQRKVLARYARSL